MNPVSHNSPGPSRQAADLEERPPAVATAALSSASAGGSRLADLPRRPAPLEGDVEPATRASHPLPWRATPLGGYLLARRLDRRPVSPEGVAALSPTDKAMEDARQAMPIGRGNVDADIGRTNHQSEVRALAGQEMRAEFIQRGEEIYPDFMLNLVGITAAAARTFGAGNCFEHAASAALSYGSRALIDERPPGEALHIVRHETQEHYWAEVHPRGVPGIVMDPWSEGPAVFAEDSRFGKDRSLVVSIASLNVLTAARLDELANDIAEETKRLGPAELQPWVEEAQRILSNPDDRFEIWQPQRVLDDAFSERVRNRLCADAPQKALQVELEAVSLSMSLGSSRVSDIVTGASNLVEQAKALVLPSGWPAGKTGDGQ